MELEDVIECAQSALLNLQRPEGYWLGDLEGNSTLCSDYMAFMHWSGEVQPEREKKCVEHLLENQLENGGWSVYQGGPARLDPSVKAYLALKLAGFESSALDKDVQNPLLKYLPFADHRAIPVARILPVAS
jgi:squalene-hopene/tetraprenyl-beta-curcumene cyclase